MPYIKKTRAKEFGDEIRAIGAKAEVQGELNWMITQVMLGYISSHNLRYQHIADAIGGAENAADELRRRLLHRYEQKVSLENDRDDPYRRCFDEIES